MVQPEGTAVIEAFREKVAGRLLAGMNGPRWEGRLSGSALATAVAVFALDRVDRQRHEKLVTAGLDWIASHPNPDGGWGDSPESPSNVTATILCWCALGLRDAGYSPLAGAAAGAERWIKARAGGGGPAEIRRAILARYGDDRTFAAPILTMCALAGKLGGPPGCWSFVPQLPLELALLPSRFFRTARLTVVSYALPALIAIGLVRHRHAPSGNRALRALRDRSAARLLDVAERMQPSNGGYEEATPLTAFVTMSLASAGFEGCAVVRRGAAFLRDSVRPDGSWPIDTNLTTWVTSLAVAALCSNGRRKRLDVGTRGSVARWLTDRQLKEEHPLTYGAPGGWPWTDLPGGMPDADDTAGALIALRLLGAAGPGEREAARRGAGWLLDLQNRDGGIPTFSKGWGRLPFDRSCPDITAHAMEALRAWEPGLAPAMRRRVMRAFPRMIRYLRRCREPAGGWKALWFGNQYVPDEGNRTYATARVVIALDALRRGGMAEVSDLVEGGREWLLSAQLPDGSWGGDRACRPSIEETALAVAALAGSGGRAAVRGVEWLISRTKGGTEFPAEPIGLYFASLWYSEDLYPVIFTAWALELMTTANE